MDDWIWKLLILLRPKGLQSLTIFPGQLVEVSLFDRSQRSSKFFI